MADLDHNLRDVNVLPVFSQKDLDARAGGAYEGMEAVSKMEMLLVGSGGLLSAAIVALGLWKLVELVA